MPSVSVPADRELVALAATVGRLRTERRLSQEEASLKSGLSRRYFHEVENRRRSPTYRALGKMAGGLGMSLVGLLRTLADDLEASRG